MQNVMAEYLIRNWDFLLISLGRCFVIIKLPCIWLVILCFMRPYSKLRWTDTLIEVWYVKQVVTSFFKSWDQLGDVFTKELRKMGKMDTYAPAWGKCYGYYI